MSRETMRKTRVKSMFDGVDRYVIRKISYFSCNMYSMDV